MTRNHWNYIVPLVVSLGCALPARAHGTPNGRAREVCAGLALADHCEFTDHHDQVHRGTCRSFDDVLLCVRNRPLEPAPSTESIGPIVNPSPASHSSAWVLLLLMAGLAVGPFLSTRQRTLQ